MLLLKIVKLVYFTRQFILQGKIPVLQGNLQGRLLLTLDSIPKIFHTPKALNGDIIIYKSL